MIARLQSDAPVYGLLHEVVRGINASLLRRLLFRFLFLSFIVTDCALSIVVTI